MRLLAVLPNLISGQPARLGHTANSSRRPGDKKALLCRLCTDILHFPSRETALSCFNTDDEELLQGRSYVKPLGRPCCSRSSQADGFVFSFGSQSTLHVILSCRRSHASGARSTAMLAQ